MDGEESFTTIPTLEVGEDDFASTRPPDDIFDLEPLNPPKPPSGPRAGNERGRRGDRGAPRGGRGGRGRGGHRDRERGGHMSDNYRSNAERQPPARVTATREEDDGAEPAQTVVEESPERSPQVEVIEETGTEGGSNNNNSQSARPPRKEKKLFPSGDRSATGGLKKPKLTEDELTERMNAIKLANQRRTERHIRAAEDEVQFNEAEKARKEADAVRRMQDRKKKVEMEKNRRELDAEREQNRQRKLKALSNREWDSAKNEEDFNAQHSSGYNPRSRRGAHGGVAGTISSPSAAYSRNTEGAEGEEVGTEDQSHDGFSPRGRGGRGRGRGRGDRGDRGDRRGGRGGGRGGGRDSIATEQSLNASISSEAEFPSLPASKTKPEAIATAKANEKVQDEASKAFDAMSPVGNWAEEATAHAND